MKKALSFGAIILGAWICFVVWSTDEFQNCLGEEEERNKVAAETKENPPQVVLYRLIINARNDTVCALRGLYEFREATTALATAFIAIFTFTLWWSTGKIVESCHGSGEGHEGCCRGSREGQRN